MALLINYGYIYGHVRYNKFKFIIIIIIIIVIIIIIIIIIVLDNLGQ